MPQKTDRPPHAVVHAAQRADEPRLCGVAGNIGGWSKRRGDVTCASCQAEIGRRLMTPGDFDPKTGRR